MKNKTHNFRLSDEQRQQLTDNAPQFEFRQLDQEGSIFYSRQLELIKARTFEVYYQDIVFRDLMTINNEGGGGIQSITYRVYDKRGMAKIIGAYAKDIPRVDVATKEVTIKVRTVSNFFAHNVDEIEAAAAGGERLEQERANAARRATEEEFERIMLFGDTTYGLPGMLNNANVTVSNVVNGASGESEWTDKTALEVLGDVNTLFGSIHETSRGRHMANRLLLPLAQWNYIVSTPLGDNADKTIASFLVDNSPWLNSLDDIRPVNQLNGAGAANSDRMVAYDPSIEVLEGQIPKEITFRAPQEEGLEVKTFTHSRIAGCNIYRPLGMEFADGI